jgi:hypothetical protein
MHKLDKPIRFPESTRVERVIPKNKIYEAANVNAAVTTQFVAQVEQIKWAYKLSAKTLNIEPSKAVPEIQVFELKLKGDAIDERVLEAIDKAIPLPILFKLIRELDNEQPAATELVRREIRYVAAYKRQSQADNAKWVTSFYVYSDWLIEQHDVSRATQSDSWRALPPAISMGELYRAILDLLLPYPLADGESLESAMQRIENIEKTDRECYRLQKRLNAEKQFNRKVEINRNLRALQQELAALKKV